MAIAETSTIPVVDISASNPHAAEDLLSAASTHGFVYIENNEAGIDTAVIDAVFKLSREFFNLPVAIKEQAAIQSNEAGSNIGWLKQGVEKLDPATQKKPDVKEALNISVPLTSQTLPAPLQPHREIIVTFQAACQKLCLQILSQFARALRMSDDWFATRHDHASGKSGTILRVLYYPALKTAKEASIEDVRAGAHSDYGSITLLFQLPGQPGLEIRNADGTWSSVPVDPSRNAAAGGKSLPILVNIGDLLEDWTAGLLRSTVHRVVFPADAKDAGDRYSIAYFCHPLDDVVLEPVPSEVVEQRAEKTNSSNESITARQHLMRRLAESYSIVK